MTTLRRASAGTGLDEEDVVDKKTREVDGRTVRYPSYTPVVPPALHNLCVAQGRTAACGPCLACIGCLWGLSRLNRTCSKSGT